MRRMIAFPCEGDTLFGTVDEAAGRTGLLIVSGGNEIRIGAHRGMALMAAQLACRGIPVLRYDRRGIGDSTGHNRGFGNSAADIEAAATAFRQAQPQLDRVVAFGNCDAASALALYDRGRIDALVLANPWVIEATDKDDDALPPPAAIRARYAERLKDPATWLRLVRGGIDLRKAVRGLRRAAVAPAPAGGLAERIAERLAAKKEPVTILAATRDNTAIAFLDAWESPVFAGVRGRMAIDRLASASHSFAGPGDQEWLVARLMASVRDADARG